MSLKPFNAVMKKNHLSTWADISKYHFKTAKTMLFLKPLRIYAMSNHSWVLLQIQKSEWLIASSDLTVPMKVITLLLSSSPPSPCWYFCCDFLQDNTAGTYQCARINPSWIITTYKWQWGNLIWCSVTSRVSPGSFLTSCWKTDILFLHQLVTAGDLITVLSIVVFFCFNF